MIANLFPPSSVQSNKEQIVKDTETIKQGTNCKRHRKSVLLHKIQILEQNETVIYI